jgi:hypothetical protein
MKIFKIINAAIVCVTLVSCAPFVELNEYGYRTGVAGQWKDVGITIKRVLKPILSSDNNARTYPK